MADDTLTPQVLANERVIDNNRHRIRAIAVGRAKLAAVEDGCSHCLKKLR